MMNECTKMSRTVANELLMRLRRKYALMSPDARLMIWRDDNSRDERGSFSVVYVQDVRRNALLKYDPITRQAWNYSRTNRTALNNDLEWTIEQGGYLGEISHEISRWARGTKMPPVPQKINTQWFRNGN